MQTWESNAESDAVMERLHHCFLFYIHSLIHSNTIKWTTLFGAQEALNLNVQLIVLQGSCQLSFYYFLFSAYGKSIL